MNGGLSAETIKGIIETAFAPLRCAVEVYDYEAKLRFRVFDWLDNGILQMPGTTVRSLNDASDLKSLILEARASILRRGYALTEWS